MNPEKAYEIWKAWIEKIGPEYDSAMRELFFGMDSTGNPFIGASEEECELIISQLDTRTYWEA